MISQLPEVPSIAAMKTKYKDSHWGTSIKKLPWDYKKDKTPTEELISATMDEWYLAKHRTLSTEEVNLINSIEPLKCHHCKSKDFIKYGKYRNGINRFKCKDCNRTFNNLTNTIFDSHKIPISEWFEYLIHLFEFHSIKSSARDNKNASSTGKYWLIKVFKILKNYQDDIVLSSDVVFDETFFTVVESKRTYKDGNKLRGISKDKICVAVATDGFRTIILSENVSKPSSKSTLDTLRNHLKPGSKLIHDDEHSHQALIKELNLKEEFCKSSYQEYLSEDENPLTPINKIHSYIKKFMRNHEGFSRDNLQDWMNLISFIINDPANRYEKLKIFLKMAISKPNLVRYRQVMSKKG
jgi:transposase-like protein